MIVRTKKYKMPYSLYVTLGMKNVLYIQWWIFPLVALFAMGTLWLKTIWFALLALLFLLGYFVFWLVQFYGLTQLEENRPMFERITYEIASNQLVVHVTPRQGMAIPWNQIQKAYKTKRYFLLRVSKFQFFYIPFKIFNAENEIKFVTAVLQRKGLLQG